MDETEKRTQVVGKVVRTQRGLGGDHPATDVHPHGRGDDGPFGRDHRSDGRPETEVRIGHERDVVVHDREAGGGECLIERLGVDFGGPGQQTVTVGVWKCWVVGSGWKVHVRSHLNGARVGAAWGY